MVAAEMLWVAKEEAWILPFYIGNKTEFCQVIPV